MVKKKKKSIFFLNEFIGNMLIVVFISNNHIKCAKVCLQVLVTFFHLVLGPHFGRTGSFPNSLGEL